MFTYMYVAAIHNSTADVSREDVLDPSQIADDGRIIGLTVHRTDKLKTDTWMAHPLVRVSLVDLDTETFVKKQNTYAKSCAVVFLLYFKCPCCLCMRCV